MMVYRLACIIFIAAGLGAGGAAMGQTPQEIALIREAMPSTAQVRPERPRRLLIFSQALTYHHASIPYGEVAFQIMGEKTGAFTTELCHDGAELTADKLARYDAVLFNNTTGDFLTTPSQRQALVDFVRSGKGIIGIHAATDSNHSWEEYGDMIGGFFVNHPWTADTSVTLKIEEPGNAVARAFKMPTFDVKDEIYEFGPPYSRGNLRVLVSLDTDRTDMHRKGIARTDNDFPVSWIKRYGKGRVFYCSVGHNAEIYWNPTILGHYLDGIQFAMGDLDAPAEPLTAMAEAARPTLNLPPRPAQALEGSRFAESVALLPLAAREDAIYKEVAGGNVPPFLRNLQPVSVSANVGGKVHTGRIFVAPDYLCVGSDLDYIRMPMTPYLAQRIADLTSCSLPTKRMVDAVWAAATCKLEPLPIPPSARMITVPVFQTHELMVRQQRTANPAPLGSLVAGDKKDIVITPRLYDEATSDRVAIYGWHRLRGQPIQQLYLGHEGTYADYSHGVRLVAGEVSIDGNPVNMRDALTSPAMATLFSDEETSFSADAPPRYRLGRVARRVN